MASATRRFFCLRRFFVCACPRPSAMQAPGHVPTPRPPDQCGRRQRTCVPAASRTDTGTWEDVCSTEQAPESLNLCCHSLPSAGPHRPFPGRVPNPLVRPILPASSRSGRAGRGGMCVGLGSNGLECAALHSFTMCALSHAGGHRRGSHRYAPRAHSPLAHTHPKPGAGSDPGSHLTGMGGWVCNPSVLRFGRISGVRPSAIADRGNGPRIFAGPPLSHMPGYQGQPSRGFQDVYLGLPMEPNQPPKLEACACGR